MKKQVTTSIEDDLHAKMRKDAQAKGQSIYQWLADAIQEKVRNNYND